MKGIGYDSVSHDYKVVVISSFDKYCGNVYVFNLRTNTWKQATYSPYHYNKKSEMPGVFVNRFLHWIFDSRHSKPVIVAFSLADEKLSELPSPTLYNEVDIMSDSDTKLVALGEKLAIFHELKGEFWLMNDYGAWGKEEESQMSKICTPYSKVALDNLWCKPNFY
ncbi:F-box associated domain containing protein [Tanacetum coccineum]